MKTTNEKSLREKENRIKCLISHGETNFTETFDFLHKHYVLKNLSGKEPILTVFEAIYINNTDLPAWKLALYCNLSRTTVFNYRNTIVNDFYICLSKKLATQEIAPTKGESNDV